MSKCSIVTNGKGGVGKTIVASAIAETQRGYPKVPCRAYSTATASTN